MQRRFKPEESPMSLEPLVQLWMLRILIPMGGLKPMVRDSLGNHEVFIALGAGDAALDVASDAKRHAVVLPKLKALWREAEACADELQAPAVLRSNVERLGASLGLDKTDRSLLEWACLVSANRLLLDTANTLGSMYRGTTFSVLARILGLPTSEVQRALGPRSLLLRSGLLRLDSRGRADLGDKLELISQDFANAIQMPEIVGADRKLTI